MHFFLFHLLILRQASISGKPASSFFFLPSFFREMYKICKISFCLGSDYLVWFVFWNRNVHCVGWYPFDDHICVWVVLFIPSFYTITRRNLYGGQSLKCMKTLEFAESFLLCFLITQNRFSWTESGFGLSHWLGLVSFLWFLFKFIVVSWFVIISHSWDGESLMGGFVLGLAVSSFYHGWWCTITYGLQWN